MPARKAAPPKRAAAPMAPVGLAIQAPSVEDELESLSLLSLPALPAPPVGVCETMTWLVLVTRSVMVVVGVGWPDVNGTSEAVEVAPKALSLSEEFELEFDDIWLGFKTWSMT